MTRPGHLPAVDDEVGERIRHVLLALADLSPTAEQGEPGASVPPEWFRWLPLAALALFDTSLLAAPLVRGGPLSFFDGVSSTRVAAIERGFAERLAAVDQLRPSQRSLRVGWLFVAGEAVDGAGKGRSTRSSPSRCGCWARGPVSSSTAPWPSGTAHATSGTAASPPATPRRRAPLRFHGWA